jgi:hypothetical protein
MPTFTELKRKHEKGRRLARKTDASAQNARNRYEQRRQIQEVDSINALVAEVCACVKPRNEMSEDEELAEKSKMGLAATFDFKQRNKFSRLLMFKMTHRARTQTSLHVPEALGEYERPSMGKQPLSGNPTAGGFSFSVEERKNAIKNGACNDLMYDPQGAIGKQPLSNSRSAPARSINRVERFKSKNTKLDDDGPDFMMPPSSMGTQYTSEQSSCPGFLMRQAPGGNFYKQAAEITPGPGHFPKVGEFDNEYMERLKTRAPRITAEGKWKSEKETMRDALAEALVGPGSYDVIGSLGNQKESLRKTAMSRTFGPPPDPFAWLND